MATLDAADDVVKALQGHRHGFALFHCCAVYPPLPEELRLGNIPFLINRHDIPIGFSDHTIENQAAIAARKMGAVLFEKHVTTDRSHSGPDHGFAIEFEEFPSYVNSIKETPLGMVKANDFENPGARELVNKRSYLKSVIAKNDLPVGKIITADDIYLARPGTGIVPADLDKVIGSRVVKAIESEMPLQWSDLSQ